MITYKFQIYLNRKVSKISLLSWRLVIVLTSRVLVVPSPGVFHSSLTLYCLLFTCLSSFHFHSVSHYFHLSSGEFKRACKLETCPGLRVFNEVLNKSISSIGIWQSNEQSQIEIRDGAKLELEEWSPSSAWFKWAYEVAWIIKYLTF